MSERWKPQDREKYWIIESGGSIGACVWDGWGGDQDRYKFGNCFKTEEEAIAKRDKIQALLTECLPELTVDVFSLPDCPEWADWAAVDSSGDAFWYSDLPHVTGCEHMWDSVGAFQEIQSTFDASDWQNSLIKRPNKATLPDWCEVGAWVYDKQNKDFVQVAAVSDNEVCFSCGVYCSVDYKAINNDYAKAQVVPYSPTEMRGMVGKALEFDGNLDLVTSYDAESHEVFVDGGWYGAKSLLESGYTYMGKPAGRLIKEDE